MADKTLYCAHWRHDDCGGRVGLAGGDRRPLCGCGCHATFERPGRCQHPQISDEQLVAQEARIARSWGSEDALKCPDCGEYLYPHGDPADGGRVYVGEPYGAAMA